MVLRSLFSISAFLGCFCILGQLQAGSELNIPGYRIVWNDEFEGEAVDPGKWDVNVGVNAWYIRESDGLLVEPHWFNEEFEPWTQAGTIGDERQYYSPDQVTVDEGILQIRSDRKEITDPVGIYDPAFHVYKSGKMNTADEFQFTFGIVKMRAQLPAGQGMWPAFWMLNAPDPWYWDDEIDIMEARGSRPNDTSSAHHYKVLDGVGNRQNLYNFNELDAGVNLQVGFHEYSLEWTSSRIRTMLDDQDVFTDETRIPQGPMFLILNAAVGGVFDGVPADDEIFPAFYNIDWVRVWQPAPTPSDLATGGFEMVQGAHWANWNTADDGNISSVSDEALHGSHSVQIDRRKMVITDPGSRGPDLLAGETAGPWRGFLNRLTAENEYIGGEEVDPSSLPATVTGDSATLSVSQSAPSTRAIAVVFREFNGSVVEGRTLIFSGTVAIEEAFPEGIEATVFVRIFKPDFSFTDIKTSVLEGGDFSLKATIPETDVPVIQVGIETNGLTRSAGRLSATGLYLEEDGTGTPGSEPATGFVQTVTATPGQTVEYGLLVANHPSDPIGDGAEGRLVLEFLDANEAVIQKTSTVIVDKDSSSQITPYVFEETTPANASWAKLSIERYSTDLELDVGGSFLADAAFLRVPNDTELPRLTSQPSASLTINAGVPFQLSVDTTSPTAVDYQWYLNGEKISNTKDFSFVANEDSGGSYFVVANNEAGPVIGAVTEVMVEADFPDADGDQISDSDEETLHGTDPLKPDSDFDGVSDYNEIFVYLTDPLDATSLLIITDFALEGEQINLTFLTRPGISYIIEGSSELADWEVLRSPYLATGTSSTVVVNRPVRVPPLTFFRVGPIK